jgi:hypothetical protein
MSDWVADPDRLRAAMDASPDGLIAFHVPQDATRRIDVELITATARRWWRITEATDSGGGTLVGLNQRRRHPAAGMRSSRGPARPRPATGVPGRRHQRALGAVVEASGTGVTQIFRLQTFDQEGALVASWEGTAAPAGDARVVVSYHDVTRDERSMRTLSGRTRRRYMPPPTTP